MTDRTLLLVGCGRMGRALMKRWREAPPADVTDFWVIDPHNALIGGMESNWVSDFEFLPYNVQPNIVVFALKPQKLSRVLPAYYERFGARPLYVSVAAGKTLSFYESYFGKKARVVRAMPNTPALIGQGVTALCARPGLSALSKKMSTELMEAIGSVVWMKDDAMMDVATAISGSGPAYMFLYMESMIEAGINAGLPENQARQLVMETVIGSCLLADQSDESLEELREQVTSPGGTTAAALKVLMKNDRLKKTLQEAVDAAIAKSKIMI